MFRSAIWVGFAALAGCGGGGGGGGDSASADPLAPQAQVDLKDAAAVFGVDQAVLDAGGGGDGGGGAGAGGAAGDGAPWRRVIVVLTDRAGQSVVGLTDDNGRFLLKFDPSRFNAPYVLQAVDQGGKVLSSVVTDVVPSGKAAWVNVNPLTDKIVSGALASDVAGTDKLFTGGKVSTDSVTAGSKAVVDSVRTALSSVLPAGVGAFDPIRSRYSYDGQGVDAIIDSVSHVRRPDTGATELRPKLAKLTTDSAGTEVAVPVTTVNPLSADQVLASNSQAFTVPKLQRWLNEMNRCLALSAAAAAADAGCADTDGSRLVSSQYRAVGKDFREHLRALYSEADGSAISGSVIRRGVMLFVERSPGSAIDDLVAVELLIRQPRIGPRGPDGAVASAVEYPLIVRFRRDDTLTRAVAGNWILFGDQLVYNIAVFPRYLYYVQINPAIINQRQVISSSVQFSIARRRWNASSQSYVDANLRAVRIKGPGLPAAGLVMSPSNVCGAAGFLTIVGKTGQIPAAGAANSSGIIDYRLAFALPDGTPLGIDANEPLPWLHAPQLNDFSGMRAYSQYTFEVFLNSNTTNVPDKVESARMFAPVLPPQALLGLPVNNPIPNLPLVTAPAPAIAPGDSVTISWLINPLAAPVTSVGMAASTTQPVALLGSPVPGASSLGNLPTSQTMTVPTTSIDPNCGAGVPALLSGGPTANREVNIRSLQAWSVVIYDGVWSNP